MKSVGYASRNTQVNTTYLLQVSFDQVLPTPATVHHSEMVPLKHCGSGSRKDGVEVEAEVVEVMAVVEW